MSVITVKSRCPLCGHGELEVNCFTNQILVYGGSMFEVKCPMCGLSGIGETGALAYEDMIRRAPYQSLEETLGAYLGSIDTSLDDLQKATRKLQKVIAHALLNGLELWKEEDHYTIEITGDGEDDD